MLRPRRSDRARQRRSGRRAPSAALAAITLLASCLALPSVALEDGQAARVVAVLEALAAETGDTVYYDEDAADDWYRIDGETSRRIPAAGFTQASWKEAFDSTLTGFVASIPLSEFEQMFADFEKKLGEMPGFTERQRQEAIATWRAEIKKLEPVRVSGATHVGVVKPYTARLRQIVLKR